MAMTCLPSKRMDLRQLSSFLAPRILSLPVALVVPNLLCGQTKELLAFSAFEQRLIDFVSDLGTEQIASNCTVAFKHFLGLFHPQN